MIYYLTSSCSDNFNISIRGTYVCACIKGIILVDVTVKCSYACKSSFYPRSVFFILNLVLNFKCISWFLLRYFKMVLSLVISIFKDFRICFFIFRLSLVLIFGFFMTSHFGLPSLHLGFPVALSFPFYVHFSENGRREYKKQKTYAEICT